mmetsp:Transcript_9387/g.23363  ORF Transcript_9387/g.23363 Transcript_9387/m.23363 type:complete len:232 (+) Transcript_9387:1941-2636(+)
MRIERLWRQVHVLNLFEQADAQDKLLCVVVCEDAIDVAEEVILDALADLPHCELLVGHHLVAQLDAQEPGSTPVRVVVLIRQLVILRDPFLVLLDAGVLRVRVPKDLGEGGHLLQRCVLEHALHVLRTLLLLAEVAREEDGQRWGLHLLRHVDEFLQTGHTERHVLGADAREVEGIEGHLCGRLPDTLRCEDANGLSWEGARLHEALLDLAAEPIEGLLRELILLENLLRA